MTIPRGLSAFPITPADGHGQVDTGALRKLIARLADAQVDSIGLLGSTGTYMFLTRDQRRRALEAALDEVNGRAPIIAGIGAMRTDDAVRHAQDAKALGAVAGLLPAVSYTPLTQDEVFDHFAAVARDSGLPIVIYDNPVATHFQFTDALLQRLAAVPGIVAVKNAATAPDRRALFPKIFSVGCSGDWVAADALLNGGDVWYSVLGGLLPKVCVKLVRAARAGDAAEAQRLNGALEPVWALFKQHSGMRVVYALADLLEICRADPPKPVQHLPAAAKQHLAEILRGFPAEILET